MILYLDTSALVKLYAVEEGRGAVEHAVEEAELIVTSAVAYAEARATLARKHREGVFSEEEHIEAVAALDEDWRTLEVLSVTENVARFAGNLAEQHALRGFDAIHLASALLVRTAILGQSSGEADQEDVLFGRTISRLRLGPRGSSGQSHERPRGCSSRPRLILPSQRLPLGGWTT